MATGGQVKKPLKLCHKSAYTQDSGIFYVSHLSINATSNLLSAAGSSTCIRLYNVDTLVSSRTLQGHSKPVSGLQFSHDNPSVLWSSSLDGTLRQWDVRQDCDKAVNTITCPDEHVVTCFDISCSDETLCAGTEAVNQDVFMYLWDTRQLQKALPERTFEESHSDDITQVKFHPSSSHLMATGSTDGLMCLFDLSKTTEEDALETVMHSNSSVGRIGFFGGQYEFLYCLTHTETLHFWNGNEGNIVAEFNDIRDTFEDQYCVDYLVDCFYQPKTQHLSLVTGSNKGDLELFDMKSNKLHHAFSLHGGHSQTVRSLQWVDKTNCLVTGAEDGVVCLWNMELVTEKNELPTRKSSERKVQPSAMDKLNLRGSKPYDKKKKKK